jgi:hypothetical protein
VTYYRDADGDTYGDAGDSTVATSQPAGYVTDSNDCDDSDASINPGATEICNSVDDNCDGTIDEGCVTYYRDADGDTYGDAGDSTVATSQPTGYVTDSSDCNDSNASINPGATETCNGVDDNCDGNIDEGCVTYYRDADGDTYGDAGDSTVATSQPAGYVTDSSDCNDSNASINPGATEICNSVDDNCDGNVDEGCVTYYRDADGDTYGDPGDSTTDTSQPSGYVANAGDCDDTNGTINPGATEICNGVDDNCDGTLDEGCSLLYRDADGDGYGNPAGPTSTYPQSGYVANTGDCNDSNSAINPGATEICNGVDDNCDGTVDEGCATYYGDTDGDGFGDPGDATTATSQPAGYVANAGDCDDTNGAINPGATEICNDVDDNCDGNVDEGCVTYYRDADGDTYGNPGNTTTGTSQPTGYVGNASDCNDGNAGINPGATEICNTVDDNCDGTVDEGCITYYRDADNDGFGTSGNIITSQDSTPPLGYAANDGDCIDTDNDIHPGATEQCNGVDDDCDGATDEGCVTYYEDADGDTFGNPAITKTVASPAPPPGYVSNDRDCDDTDSNVYPGAADVDDGIDNDCSGAIDDGGLCTGASNCFYCDFNDDDVCDEEDLVLFGFWHGWDDWDCDYNNDPECICDLVPPNNTCNELDGICFWNAFSRDECRASLYIEKIRRRRSEPGDAIRILGKGFGNGSPGDAVHVKGRVFEYGHPKIKIWTDTKIKLKIPIKKYTKDSCQWFNGNDFRRVNVWVTVGGRDSNKFKIKLLKPDTCP